jgi:ATP-dependent DNA helicase MPH1
MSSPSRYWDDEELNFAVLNELAAIDPPQVASTSKPTVRKPSPALRPTPLTVGDSDDLYDLTFDVGVQDLQRLDAAIEKDYRKKADPTSKSPSSGALTTRPLPGRQTTLFGDVISPRTSPSKKPPSSRQQRKSPTRPVNRKTKKWDHTTFAKTGRRRRAGKGKGKENLDEEGDEGEDVEFEQFPAPFVPGKLIA